MAGRAIRRLSAFEALDNLPQVLWSGAAATAHQAESELADELLERVSQLDRLQRIDRPVGSQLRQTSIRHAADPDCRIPGEMPQMLTHLRWAGRTVQPDHVDAERLERGERCTDLGAEQHGARGLDRHVHDHRKIAPGVRQRPFGTQRGGLGLQQIL